jgi:hypothetical protein
MIKVWDTLKTKNLNFLLLDSNLQPLQSEADAYAHLPSLSTMPEAYLKVTALTVALSGRFTHHLTTSSDMDKRPILTCITSDLPEMKDGYSKIRKYI